MFHSAVMALSLSAFGTVVAASMGAHGGHSLAQPGRQVSWLQAELPLGFPSLADSELQSYRGLA